MNKNYICILDFYPQYNENKKYKIIYLKQIINSVQTNFLIPHFQYKGFGVFLLNNTKKLIEIFESLIEIISIN